MVWKDIKRAVWTISKHWTLYQSMASGLSSSALLKTRPPHQFGKIQMLELGTLEIDQNERILNLENIWRNDIFQIRKHHSYVRFFI